MTRISPPFPWLLVILSFVIFTFPKMTVSCRSGVTEKETIPSQDDLNCPNEIFISKHFCSECESAGDALRFSMQRNMGYRPTSVNTVFIGTSSYRFNTRKKLCEFAAPVQTFRCSQLLDNYSKAKCKELGYCHASHDSVTGFMFFDKLICE